MRTSASWACAAILSAAASGTFTHVFAGGQNPNPAPSPREKPTDEGWLPKPESDPRAKENKFLKDLSADPPSAFPDIDIPEADRKDSTTRDAAFERLCPRLRGKVALAIEPTDDPHRKLLKARLHQGTLEFQQHKYYLLIAGPGQDYKALRECLLDMQSAVTELWAEKPKELVPWLEELLVASKDHESRIRVRVLTGTIPPSDLNAARRLRLKMEAELWKAKAPK